MASHEIIVIKFPWPDKGLSPNARHSRFALSKLRAVARMEAGYETLWALREAGLSRGLLSGLAKVEVDWEFRPPDARRRDEDNIIASLKAHLDGMAEILGIDDSKIVSSRSMGDPLPPGWVIATVHLPAGFNRGDVA